MTEWFMYNLNDRVRFRMTAEGERIWHMHYARSPRPVPLPPVVNGHSELQMWRLMEIYGPHIDNAEPPIEMDVLIGVRRI